MYIVDFPSIVFPENLWRFQGMEAMNGCGSKDASGSETFVLM
jgi:hypothetical protein